ncbi:MAG: PEP-utilizing enzyme, partial [Planctomycetota bacterium]
MIGTIALVGDADGRRVPRRSIAADTTPQAELARFHDARRASMDDLQAVHAEAEKDMGAETARVFLFHIGVLSDPAMIAPIEERILNSRLTAEYAVFEVFREWAERFAKQADSAFRTKVNDLNDIASRLVSRLRGVGEPEKSWAFDPDTIVFARDLSPSQTAAFDRDRVTGFVTDLGGPTSHTAIVARALGLPAVVGCQRATAAASDGERVIIDGDRGKVILSPDDETIARYRGSIARAESYRISLREVSGLPAITPDGTEINLVGNIEFPDEIDRVIANGGVGVGLYRTEFLYLAKDSEPSEEDHYDAYADCVRRRTQRRRPLRRVRR